MSIFERIRKSVLELAVFLHRRNKTVFRLFDKNFDGYIDKKEFRWMTTSAVISPKTIKTVFEVGKSSLVDFYQAKFRGAIWIKTGSWIIRSSGTW